MQRPLVIAVRGPEGVGKRSLCAYHLHSDADTELTTCGVIPYVHVDSHGDRHSMHLMIIDDGCDDASQSNSLSAYTNLSKDVRADLHMLILSPNSMRSYWIARATLDELSATRRAAHVLVVMNMTDKYELLDDGPGVISKQMFDSLCAEFTALGVFTSAKTGLGLRTCFNLALSLALSNAGVPVHVASKDAVTESHSSSPRKPGCVCQ